MSDFHRIGHVRTYNGIEIAGGLEGVFEAIISTSVYSVIK